MDLALLLSCFGLGLRHGVDWDHIAAIADITGSEPDTRRSRWLAVVYALGHGAAVLGLGALAVAAGALLPGAIDPIMERFVGATLLVLAAVLVWSLVSGRRTVSRGMLLLGALGRARDRLRRLRRVVVAHEHPHEHGRGHDHGHDDARGPERAPVRTTHRHAHEHDVTVSGYGTLGALVIGLLHGIGAETGTQAVVLVGASQVSGGGAGIAVVTAFGLGVIATTCAMAIGSSVMWRGLRQDSRLMIGLTALTAGLSAVLGALYLTGNGSALPAILG